ncbi:MAG: hypothetical protein NT069_30795 [Planctomycetota bacterium]|nr:hypothetical protein [Planctomycetota bacterium]
MNNRQKWMLGGLAAVIAVWQVPGMVDSMVFAPASTRQDQIDTLQQEVTRKEKDRQRQRKGVKQMAELGKRSLPPDPIIAEAVFQNWLTDTATGVKLTNVVVDRPRADNQKKENTYFLVRGEVNGNGTLGQVAELLHELQKSGLLMKVTSLRMDAPRREADPNLKIKLQVEAMALLSSPVRTTMWVDGTAPGPLSETKLAGPETFEAISKKNLFVRGYNGPPKAAEPPPTTPPAPPPPPPPTTPSTAEYVYLVGSVIRNGVSDAFLYDRSSNKQTVLKRGADFKAGGMEGKVIEIADKSVTLRVGEDEFRLDLGKNLTQMVKLKKTEGS